MVGLERIDIWLDAAIDAVVRFPLVFKGILFRFAAIHTSQRIALF
jgi:hypothetical protein